MITFISSFVVLITFGITNTVSAQAVPLTHIHTGNSALDKAIPHFYSCITKAIKSNKHAHLDSYFDTEPTKNEVITCYHQVFDNNNNNSNDRSSSSSSSSSNHHDKSNRGGGD
jgi:hypothetical protein